MMRFWSRIKNRPMRPQRIAKVRSSQFELRRQGGPWLTGEGQKGKRQCKNDVDRFLNQGNLGIEDNVELEDQPADGDQG